MFSLYQLLDTNIDRCKIVTNMYISIIGFLHRQMQKCYKYVYINYWILAQIDVKLLQICIYQLLDTCIDRCKIVTNMYISIIGY